MRGSQSHAAAADPMTRALPSRARGMLRGRGRLQPERAKAAAAVVVFRGSHREARGGLEEEGLGLEQVFKKRALSVQAPQRCEWLC